MKYLKHLFLMLLLLEGALVKAQQPLSTVKEQTPSLAVLATKSKAADAQILDARTSEEFAQNHLSGAINIDPASASHEKDIAALSKDKPTFVYSIANGRSAALAKELREKGFKEVIVLPGGIANWIGSGYPIVNNAKKGISLSLAQFQTLTGSSDFVLVDFGSKYCGACKKLIPVLDTLEKKTGFSAKIVRIEAYDQTALLKELKINQLPTLVLYHHKKQIWKKAGQSTSAEIEAVIAQHQTELAKSN
ncbi:Rhodanese-related sulfurtransferase [Pedobacter steynii]|uniref:Rhodanese-related sulfurtransferase n=1 Tax=Pedobacter steynii TaxID=430522 RepID=A0A1G9ZE31_9SPHI|nr:rhodanese-like domain-containing protein [Pedobacter steynii]SDN19435.1 Rhodanese-related sulfurtransferase [Pedobacter steynii]